MQFLAILKIYTALPQNNNTNLTKWKQNEVPHTMTKHSSEASFKLLQEHYNTGFIMKGNWLAGSEQVQIKTCKTLAAVCLDVEFK